MIPLIKGNRRHARLLGFAVTGALALALSGCATDLEPAGLATAAPLVGDDAAVAVAAGVQVTTLAPDRWPGPVQINEELTPMKVRIQNNSGQPLLLRYDQFSLVGADGRIYRALPLFRMDGEVPTSITVRDATPLNEPGFLYSGFEVAPFYRPVYPGLGVYDDTPFIADPGYYDLYDTYYVNAQLPTPEMRRRALPEGVLASGGYVEGYLYFQEVPDEAERVSFRYNLVSALTNTSFANIGIPYEVD